MIEGYAVRFATGEDMPPGEDWLFLEVDGRLHLVVREGRANARVLCEAWAAFRQMIAREIVPLPVPA